METEIIDKLFLELSQVTKAKTKTEIELRKKVTALTELKDLHAKTLNRALDKKHRIEADLKEKINELTSKLSDALQRLPEEGK